MRRHVERLIQNEAKPSAVFFVHSGIGGALGVILYIVLPRHLAWSDFL